MLVQNGGVAVFWLKAPGADAFGSKHGGKEARRPAVTYLARGEKGGVPTSAYKEDTGITAKVQARLQGGGRKPLPVSGPSPIWRRKERGAAKKVAKVPGTALAGGDASPGGGGTQGAPPSQGSGGRSKS